jgi:hypothetical protein
VSLPALLNNAREYATDATKLAIILDDPAHHWLILLIGEK